MSTHEVKVIRINSIEKHPNADTLGLVRIGDYTCCVRLSDFNVGDLAAYIEPDYVVPDNEQFLFLKGHTRIKCKRLRGVMSHGLLINAPAGSKEGDNVMDVIGITRYEPQIQNRCLTKGENERPPRGDYPVTDIESLRKYNDLFKEGEKVIVTEKIHGANGRYIFLDDKFYCGSHRNWKKEDAGNLWWMAAKQNPWIEGFCRNNPGTTLYGEVFGQVQDLKYGAKKDECFFAVFDIWKSGRWLNYTEMHELGMDLTFVPTLFIGEFNKELVLKMSNGDSLVKGANNIREGVVIKPYFERFVDEIGRLQLKVVSDNYLERH